MITRITSRDIFAKLSAEGVKVSSGPVSVIFVPTETAHPQLAFAITRKFGNAVKRNRARRRLRDAFSSAVSQHESLHQGAFLVLAGRKVLVAPFESLISDFSNCMISLEEVNS